MKKNTNILTCGAIGEWAHCGNCGEGLNLGKCQSSTVFLAALKAFEKDHRYCKPGWKEPEPHSLSEWETSRFVGVSSATISFYSLGGKRLYDSFDTPKDYADFARCMKLLRIRNYEQKFLDNPPPEFCKIMPRWAELRASFIRAEKSGDSTQFNKLLSKLNKHNDTRPTL